MRFLRAALIVVLAFAAGAGLLFLRGRSRHEAAERRDRLRPASMLRRIATGARAYHEELGTLPPAAAPTPTPGACCQAAAGRAGVCLPDAGRWEHPTWRALGFAIRDPHPFSYEFTPVGRGFVARAFGDLDCDGVYSTFEVTAEPAPDGSLTTSAVRATSELE